jgi:hypothetical protein
MMAYWGSGGIAPHILDLGTRWWVVSFTPRPIYPRLGGPPSRYGRGGEEKNSQPPPGLEHLVIQPTAQRYTTELSRLISGIVKYAKL